MEIKWVCATRVSRQNQLNFGKLNPLQLAWLGKTFSLSVSGEGKKQLKTKDRAGKVDWQNVARGQFFLNVAQSGAFLIN